MLKAIVFSLGLLFAVTSGAQQVGLIFEVDAPTVRDDGDALPSAEIAAYRFYSDCNDQIALMFEVSNDGSPFETTQSLEEGQHSWCFRVVDTDGFEGELSPTISYEIDFIGRPGAGSIRRVVVTCEAQRCRFSLL